MCSCRTLCAQNYSSLETGYPNTRKLLVRLSEDVTPAKRCVGDGALPRASARRKCLRHLHARVGFTRPPQATQACCAC